MKNEMSVEMVNRLIEEAEAALREVRLWNHDDLIWFSEAGDWRFTTLQVEGRVECVVTNRSGVILRLPPESVGRVRPLLPF